MRSVGSRELLLGEFSHGLEVGSAKNRPDGIIAGHRESQVVEPWLPLARDCTSGLQLSGLRVSSQVAHFNRILQVRKEEA